MIGATPSEASSHIKTRGLLINARPSASICCLPPESEPASATAFRQNREQSVNFALGRFYGCSCLTADGQRRQEEDSLEPTNPASIWRPSGTCTIPRATRWFGVSSRYILTSEPDATAAYGVMSEIDFPALFAPSTATSSRTSKKRHIGLRTVDAAPAIRTMCRWRSMSESWSLCLARTVPEIDAATSHFRHFAFTRRSHPVRW